MFRGAEGVQDTLSPHRAAMRGGLQMQAVVIGNFDGVHVGHRQLFRLAREAARGGRVVAVTFEPLPAAVLRPERPMGRLTPSPERSELLREAKAKGEIELMHGIYDVDTGVVRFLD